DLRDSGSVLSHIGVQREVDPVPGLLSRARKLADVTERGVTPAHRAQGHRGTAGHRDRADAGRAASDVTRGASRTGPVHAELVRPANDAATTAVVAVGL